MFSAASSVDGIPEPGMTPETWRRNAVRAAAPAGPVRTTITVFLHLQHTGHQPHSLVDLMGQPMRPELVAKVRELAQLGTPLPVIQAQIAQFGRDLARQLGVEQPHSIDGRFFPRDDVLRNLVQRCAGEQRLHKVDQEAVARLVAQHTEQAPRDHIHFRRSGPDERMLLVLQTEEQRRMLSLYGSNIVGMDATYKTSQWGFPLFLLNVVDNHSRGQPVALFFVEEETGDMIAEALRVLREWNPTWQPQHFMVDKSDAEQNAVADVFGDSTRLLLCDFHRLQAWWRWISNSDHNVKDKEGLFHALQNIANAPTLESFNTRLEQLKGSSMWTPLVQAYLEVEWLREVPKWASCYRTAFHGGINTNNYLEAMNRVLKHKWLNGRVDKRMESLLRVWIRVVSPYYSRKYLLDNVQSVRSLAMQRVTPLEPWANGRPGPVVAALQLRKQRAREALASLPDDLQQAPGRDGVYLVPRGSETLKVMLANQQADGLLHAKAKLPDFANSLEPEQRCYVTDVRGGSCTCGDFGAHCMPCKHFFMVFERTQLSWADVSASLLKQSHLVVDEAVVHGCPFTLQQLTQEHERLDRETDAQAELEAAAAEAAATAEASEGMLETAGAAGDAGAADDREQAAGGDTTAGNERLEAKQRAEAKQLADLLRGATFDVHNAHLPAMLEGLRTLWEATRSHLPASVFREVEGRHKRRRLTGTPVQSARTPMQRRGQPSSNATGGTPLRRGGTAAGGTPLRRGGAAAGGTPLRRGGTAAGGTPLRRGGTAAGGTPLRRGGAAAGGTPLQRGGTAAGRTPLQHATPAGETQPQRGAVAGRTPLQRGGEAASGVLQLRGRADGGGARMLQPPEPLEFVKGKEPGRKKKEAQDKRPFPLPQLLQQRQQEADAGPSTGRQPLHPPSTYNVGFNEQRGRPNVRLFALEHNELIRMCEGRYITLNALRPPYLPDPAAMQLQQLSGCSPQYCAELFKFAPQGCELWHALRQGRITASTFGVFLGMCEPGAAQFLGGPAYMVGHAKAADLWKTLHGGAGQQELKPCLEWGHRHEPNCTWQLLNNLQTIKGFEWVRNTVVLEQGFIAMPKQANLPPLGASPDGILMAWPGPQAATTPKSYTLEFKSRFPYNMAPDQENGEEHYLYAPHKRFAKTMPPTHYAQVQLAMLASNTQTCLYMEYTVTTTSVRVVDFDREWMETALGNSAAGGGAAGGAAGVATGAAGAGDGGVAGQVWRAWGSMAEPPENFGSQIAGYTRLLELTKAGCERAVVKAQFVSMRGKDARIFV